MFVRFEDINKDAAITLRNVLEFFGIIEINQKYLVYSVNAEGFNRLKKLAFKNKFKLKILSMQNLKDKEIGKFRKGKIGNYAEYLSEEDLNCINRLIKNYNCEFIK